MNNYIGSYETIYASYVEGGKNRTDVVIGRTEKDVLKVIASLVAKSSFTTYERYLDRGISVDFDEVVRCCHSCFGPVKKTTADEVVRGGFAHILFLSRHDGSLCAFPYDGGIWEPITNHF